MFNVIDSLIQDFKDIESAAVAGDYRTAFRKAIDAQETAFALLFGQGADPVGFAADPAARDRLKAACDAAVAACRTTRAGPGGAGRQAVLQLIVQLLPVILSLFA